MEPPSPTQTGSLRRFRALIEERANGNREMTAGSKRITKENGSIYNSTRERVDSRN